MVERRPEKLKLSNIEDLSQLFLSLLIALLSVLAFFIISINKFEFAPRVAANENYMQEAIFAGSQFLPLEPIVVTMGDVQNRLNLSLKVALSVPRIEIENIKKFEPKIIDTLTSYLHHLTIKDVDEPAFYLTLKEQMMKQVKTVIGDKNLHDLVVVELLLI